MQPKNTKYKKYYKPRYYSSRLNVLNNLKPYSRYSIIALESSYINGKQIEAARQSIRRKLKRRGILRILVFPDIAVSKKSTSSRMGKGKGKIDRWTTKINPGKILFELIGVSDKDSINALKCGSNKLPLKLKICHQ